MKSRTRLNKPQEHAWVSASAVEEVPCAELQDDQQVEDRTFLNHSQVMLSCGQLEMQSDTSNTPGKCYSKRPRFWVMKLQ